MTGLIPERHEKQASLHEKEFSRRSFLRGSGAMIVGFSVAGAGLAGRAQAASPIDPYTSVIRDLSQVDSYLAIHADNTASVMSGGVEVGTGSATGWLMIAAEELDMELSQMKYVWPDTAVTVNPQIQTASSAGTKEIGPQIRSTAAYARQKLLQLASASLGVPVGALTVSKGVVSGGGKSVTYGDLLGGKLFNVTVPVGPIFFGSFSGSPNAAGLPSPTAPSLTGPTLDPGEGPTKPISQYKLVGTRVPRVDIPDIVTGRTTYAQNVRLPGMLHGRLVLPRGQAAYGSPPQVVSIDESSVKHIANVQVVRRGDLVGVVAPKEYDAIQAAAQLKIKWADPPPISGHGNLWKQMRAHDGAGLAPARDGSVGAEYGNRFGPVGNINAAFASAAHVLSGTYTYPYQIHAPIGPQCAIADVTPNGCRIFTYSQGPTSVPASIAALIGLPANKVRITVVAGSSLYGGGGGIGNPAGYAAVMSQIVGKPVRVQLMRWDEHSWDTAGAVGLFDLRAGIDAKGKIVAWEYTALQPPYVQGRSTVSELTGARPYPYPANAGTSPVETTANGVQYELPNWRVINKTLPLYGNYFATANMRASNSSQVTFGTEVMADELAYAAGMDPIEFRRLNVRKTQLPGSTQTGVSGSNTKPITPVTWSFNERFLNVLNTVAKASGWQPRVANSVKQTGDIVTGRGVSFGTRTWPVTFGAAVVEIELNKKTGKILVKHIYAAQDSGLSINPTGAEANIVGQVVMNTSRALVEEMRFDTKRVTSMDWVTYPILRFKDHPKVTPIVINFPDSEPAGAGDHVMEHVPPAIANAFFDATGVRIRHIPMTPGVVRATLAAGGSGIAGVS
jgi:nicotinate dehydrogenase subunit B